MCHSSVALFFRSLQVAVYEGLAPHQKPAVGSELNKDAEITLLSVWPDGDEGADFGRRQAFGAELAEYCGSADMQGEFNCAA